MSDVPIWVVSVLVAASAPMMAKGIAGVMSRQHRRKTDRLLMSLDELVSKEEGGDGASTPQATERQSDTLR